MIAEKVVLSFRGSQNPITAKNKCVPRVGMVHKSQSANTKKDHKVFMKLPWILTKRKTALIMKLPSVIGEGIDTLNHRGHCHLATAHKLVHQQTKARTIMEYILLMI